MNFRENGKIDYVSSYLQAMKRVEMPLEEQVEYMAKLYNESDRHTHVL